MHETPLRESIDIDTPEDRAGVIITTSFENRSNKGKKLEMKKILITCPPMLGLKEELILIIQEAGFEPICPNVTQTMSEEDLLELVPMCEGDYRDDMASRRIFEKGVSGRLEGAVKWGIGG